MIRGLLKNDVETYITTIDNLSRRNGKGCAKCFKTYEKDDDIFYDIQPVDFISAGKSLSAPTENAPTVSPKLIEHFHQMMDIRLNWLDNTSKAEFNRSNTSVTSEEAEPGEYKAIVLKTSGYQKGKSFEEKTFKVPFNKAKRQYDVPAEYRKLMGE